MTTELVRQSGADQADGALRPARDPRTDRALGESVMRVSRRVGVELRWLEAIVRLEMGQADLASVPDLRLDRAVRLAMGVIDALPDAECEELALRAGL